MSAPADDVVTTPQGPDPATVPLADPAALAAEVGAPVRSRKVHDAIRRASARFRSAVGHPVTRFAETVRVDGTGTRALLVPSTPVLEVARVAVLEIGSWRELVDGADYEWSDSGALRRLRACWPGNLRAVEITYSHGYDPVPEDVADAVLEQAAQIYRARTGITQMSTGGESFTFTAAGVSETWSRTVAAYKRHAGERA